MKVLASLSAAVVVSAVALVSTGSVAIADSVHTLPITSFSDIVVDQAHGRVFVSGGAVAVANLDGAVTGTVSGISAARQMTLTPDGSQLVIANGDGLTIVDAATATVVRTVSTGAGSCPDALAPASGLIFFTYGECGSSSGLAAIDLSDNAITTSLNSAASFMSGSKLVSVPAAPDMLAAQFGDTLVILDTTGGATPTATTRASSNAASGNFQDLALSPDGTQVVTATGGIYHHQIFSTTDLSHVGDYTTTAYPNAVAIRSDGLVAAGIQGTYDPDIWFFPADATTPSKKVNYTDGGAVWTQARGLAFGAKLLYSVTSTDPYNGTFSLHTVSAGPPAALSITTNAGNYRYGGTATVTARLLSPTTNRTLSIYATGAGTARRLLRTANTGVNGVLSVSVAGLTRNTTFQVVFAGDGDYSGSSASRSVKVAAKLVLAGTSRRVSGRYHLVRAGSHPLIRATVSAPNPGRCVRFVGQRWTAYGWVSFPGASCVPLDSRSQAYGQLRGRFPRGTRVRIGATFLGGTVNAASPRVWYYLAFTL